MARLYMALVGVVAAVSLLPAAPIPKHLMPKDPPLAFPTRVGTTWVYEGDQGEQTIVIGAVEEAKDGAKIVTTEFAGANGPRTPHMVTRISAAGVFLVAERGQQYVEPWCIVKLPYREGQAWETNSRYLFEKQDDLGQHRFGPIEKVRVPAGEFSAVRVEWERCVNGATERRATFWYANGVGLVKMDEGMKLKSFTPGKE